MKTRAPTKKVKTVTPPKNTILPTVKTQPGSENATDHTILKHALKNALDFNGSINPKFVMGQVLREQPERKNDFLGLLKQIDRVVTKLQGLSRDQLKAKLLTLAPELLEPKEETVKGPLKPLPSAEPGKVKLRIAPSPSGLLHIGHIYGTSLNYEYAKMYNGKFYIRIEDTDPEKIYSPAYELIVDDVQWLTDGGVTEVVIQSSRLGIYYDYAEKIVSLGRAYVCTCDADAWREMKNKKESCPCRNISIKEQRLRYAKMFAEYAEGEAVLRLKTDILDKNPAMRDFAILRINEHIHPKTGKEQRVWPLMVFSVAIDDHEMGITHVLNGKEHADNALKEQIIMGYLGWKPPVYKHWGRINFEGFSVSKSKTRLAIEEGKYAGWDDIRLPFLRALRKRGYQAAAFRKFAMEIGLSLNDKTVSMDEFWKIVDAFNKEVVEPKANRYFFIDNPIKIKLEGMNAREVHLDLHPDFPQRGKRTLNAGANFSISQSDLPELQEGKLHRLMDCCNFEVQPGKYRCVPGDYEAYKSSPKRGAIIHWLPADAAIAVEVKLTDGSTVAGVGEKGLLSLDVGDIVQLERRYFARLEEKTSQKLVFWYLHR